MERTALSRLLFPATERRFRGMRWVRIALRTGHIVSFSGLVGGHVFAISAAELQPWLIASIATGVTLVGLCLFQSFRWLREVRGVAIMLKLALLCVIPFWWDARIPILMAIVVISSCVSHMPGRYRYWVIGQGPRASEPKGARG